MMEEKLQGLLPVTIPSTIGDLPSTSANGVSIVLYNGNFNTEYFGGRKGSTVFQPIVKFVVRNSSYEEAKKWVDAVKDTLHRHTDDYFLSILLSGSPLYLGRSDQKLHEFQMVFSIQLVEQETPPEETEDNKE